MATYTIIKLKNLTPLHIGTGKENYDTSSSVLQSDTLSSAITAIKSAECGSENLQSFINSFSISSAFPYEGDIYFLPKPQGKLNIKVAGYEESAIRKAIKKIKYIETSLWQDLINGKELTIDKQQIKWGFLLTVASANSFVEPFKSEVSERVSVPRDNENITQPFFFDWTYFNDKAGLYCILKASPELSEEIVNLFEKLGETGIGTDKSVGGGKFDVESSSLSIEESSQPDSIMLLSLYIPTEDEIRNLNLCDSRYQLLKRSGYMAGSSDSFLRHLRKKSIYMFDVGSVFHTTDSIDGKVVDLKPELGDAMIHPIYRSGKPIYVPIKM